MTRTRKTATKAGRSTAEPRPAVPGYCQAWSLLSEASALKIVGRGDPVVIGPTSMLNAGGYVAAVRSSGIAIKVFDMTGDCRGIFASWGATRAAVFDLVAEWEAGVDLSAA